MRLLLELSGEHPTLPAAELAAVLRSYGEETAVALRRVVVLDTAVPAATLASRLALTHFVHEELAAGSFEDIVAAASALQPSGAFSVRVKSHVTCDGKQEMERRVADQIRGTVDLTDPAVEYCVVIDEEAHHLTHRLATVDRGAFERRRAIRRPYFHPTSLHPRLTRALLNLSACPPGGRILDPFCGTGGVLLEAGLCGFRALGIDASPAMVRGTAETLDAFGVTADLRVGDVAELAVAEAEAIVTDPPYGRSATTRREPLDRLLDRFFEAAARRAVPVAVILPREDLVAVGERHLRLRERHTMRVHRSLDRHFCVFGP